MTKGMNGRVSESARGAEYIKSFDKSYTISGTARVGEKAKWYKVKDAKIPHYCFSCGRIGHGDKECEDTPESDGKNQYGEWLRASLDQQGFRNDVKVPARSSNLSKSGSFVSSSPNKNSQAGTEDSSEDPGMEATSPLRMPSNYERECNSKQSLMNAYDVEMSTVGNGKEEGSHMDVHQAEKQYKLVNVNVPDLLQQPTKGNVQSADTYEEFETSHVVDMQKQMVTMEGGACDKKASKWRRAKPKEAGTKENAGVVCGKRKKFLLKGVLSQQANDNSEELWETEGGEGGVYFVREQGELTAQQWIYRQRLLYSPPDAMIGLSWNCTDWGQLRRLENFGI